MKKLLPLLVLLFSGCTKALDGIQTEELLKTYQLSARSVAPLDSLKQIGRISWWMLYTQSNYLSARADYVEVLISDNFNSAYDTMDKIKEDTSIGSDNIALIPPYTPQWRHQKLLWKEQTQYPKDQDVIPTKFWGLSATSYVFKFICTNFPANIRVYLWDQILKQTTPLPLDGHAFYLPVDASGIDLQNSRRFSFILRRM